MRAVREMKYVLFLRVQRGWQLKWVVLRNRMKHLITRENKNGTVLSDNLFQATVDNKQLLLNSKLI